MQYLALGSPFSDSEEVTSSRWICFQCCREVAEKYPEITYEEVIIDNCCMMVCLDFCENLAVVLSQPI